MTERGTSHRRSAGARNRNPSHSATSSARSSAVFERDDQHQPAHLYPQNRYNPSLRSVNSRVSLNEQFATTRREYEFGFDDSMSFMTPSEAEEVDTDQDDTLAGASFDGVVVLPPTSHSDDTATGEHRKFVANKKTHRTHYELLCLPEGDEVTDGEIRRAYFRLYDVLRSDKLPPQHRNIAEEYFGDVQVAFETLIGNATKDEYDAAVVDEQEEEEEDDDDYNYDYDNEDDAICELGGPREKEDQRDAKSATVRRTHPRWVQRFRRQQEQNWTEVGVQMDSQPLFSPSQATRWQRGRPRRFLPAAFSLTRTSTTTVPSISHFLEPRARRARSALKGPTSPADTELYLTPPTLTLSSSVFATNARRSSYPPAGSVVSHHHQSLIPDTFPRDRPLHWYSTSLAPVVDLKLRQEVFLREAGLPRSALRRTLPDGVFEIEMDTLTAASLTARVSRTLRLGGAEEEEEQQQQQPRPLHVEASVSVSRSWLARGGNASSRLGLALHRRVASGGGAVFACADSGAPSLWGSLLSPASFWGGRGGQDPGLDSAGLWRGYMDQLSRFLGQGLVPYCCSPPTVEVGYKSSGSLVDDGLGLRSGRTFTRQALSGLRRLHDEAGLLGAGAGDGASWTASGAVTATGGVAGYMRYGRDLMSSSSSSSSSPPAVMIKDGGVRRLFERCRDLLCGFRMEAELCIHKTAHETTPIGRTQSFWGQAEFSHVAVRGLKRFGKTSKIGLEVGMGGAGNTVVLSLYLSQNNNSRRLVVPIALFGGHYLSSSSSSHHILPPFYTKVTKALLCAALIPSVCLATIDGLRALGIMAGAEPSGTGGSKRRRRGGREDAHSRRRAEADELVTVLAEPVTHRQRGQRQRGGLVIISAKYGVLDPSSSFQPSSSSLSTGAEPVWTSPEEVADVTVAVAALVGDEGALRIPEGLRKSKLLGFWDPRPGRTKCLVVMYTYRGLEGVKGVMGRGELRLP